MNGEELFHRLQAGDTSVIPGATAAKATGWMYHLDDVRFTTLIKNLDQRLPRHKDRTVLLGMGGSSSGGGLYADVKLSSRLTILDTSHPDDITQTDFSSATVIAASKSGGTVETICSLAWALDHGLDVADLVVISDPGTALHELGQSLGAVVIDGDPLTGGRFSAFSAFGVVPALLSGWTATELLDLRRPGATEAITALEDGLRCGAAVDAGAPQPYVLPGDPLLSYTSLWEEQLVAESTGKRGVGIVPLAGPTAPLPHEVLVHCWQRHWWTVGASVGMGVDPFDQPDVEAAKRNVFTLLQPGAEPTAIPAYTSERNANYVTLQVFAPLASAPMVAALRDRLATPNRLVTAGIGPRFLHSTGQLHKGGPGSIQAVQVVVEPATEPRRIPGRRYSFHDLIRAQADADALALHAAGRSVERVSLSSLDELASLHLD